jgi:hypothetical protein
LIWPRFGTFGCPASGMGGSKGHRNCSLLIERESFLGVRDFGATLGFCLSERRCPKISWFISLSSFSQFE